jgi:hypothetical protein
VGFFSQTSASGDAYSLTATPNGAAMTGRVLHWRSFQLQGRCELKRVGEGESALPVEGVNRLFS